MYPDDVTTYSKPVREYLTHVRDVLQLVQTAEVELKLANYTFSDTAVSYLGYTIGPSQLEVHKRSLAAIK